MSIKEKSLELIEKTEPAVCEAIKNDQKSGLDTFSKKLLPEFGRLLNANIRKIKPIFPILVNFL